MLTQIREDHGLVQARYETAAWTPRIHGMGVSFKQGHRCAWWGAIEWVLKTQAGWEDLTEAEAVGELRKGEGSIYYPLFKNDPRVWVDCPNDGRTVVGVEGICDSCGWEVT